VSFPSPFPFRSLFFKIFVSFWLTMALTIGVLSLMVWISNSQSLPERASRGPTREALTLFSEIAARVYERDGPQGLQELIRRSQEEAGTEIFLFDADGNPLISETADGNVANVVQDLLQHPKAQPPRPFSLFTGLTRSSWGRVVSGPSGKHYIFVARFRQPYIPPPFFSPSRIAVSILIAGAVCYLLGLYFTLPLKKLQSTVRAFAEGNLNARVPPQIARRRDELAEVGREFDHMAERIAALIDSQKRLLADISHELRSPLARLAVALELARKSTNGRAAGPLDRIEQEAERVNRLVGQLLTITRLESGAETVPPEMVVLEDLVLQVVEDADFEAKPLNKSVKAIELEQCRVRGSAELLRSGVENVVRNAIRYTAPGTVVEVTLRWRLDTAILNVRDHGPGVPEAELAHIFEPFYRVSEARERTSGGVGLGLSIADRTIKLHGGTIRAENVPGGLMVTIELPLAPLPSSVNRAPEKQPVG